MNILNNKELIESIIKDPVVRCGVTKQSHEYFFPVYFGTYLMFPSAAFHTEMMKITENEKEQLSVVVAFRGSAKSTIFSLSYPIWAVLGQQQKKFVLIISQTQVQARQILANIKEELTNNVLLKNDLGPFEEPDDEWRATSIVLPQYGARIMVASSEQSIRGLRHKSHRPDLIILDDIEDIASAKTKEGREKTFRWLASEVLPAGDINTKVIVIGNLVHEDSVIMRLKQKIKEKEIRGGFYMYPIMDEQGVSLWPEKFPTPESLKNEERKVLNPQAWSREYLLKIIPEEGQIVYPEWFQYYDELPTKKQAAYRCTYSAVDLAISQKDTADYTTVVSALVFGRANKLRIYILPNPIRRKLSFPEQVEMLKQHTATNLTGSADKLFVESVAYQDALPQMLKTQGIHAIGVKPQNDKRTRLSLTTHYIQSGKVKFPRKGCEQLIQEMVGFGIENHDDLADAFSLLILQIAERHLGESPWMMMLLGGPDYGSRDILYYSDYIDVETKEIARTGGSGDPEFSLSRKAPRCF